MFVNNVISSVRSVDDSIACCTVAVYIRSPNERRIQSLARVRGSASQHFIGFGSAWVGVLRGWMTTVRYVIRIVPGTYILN